VKKARVRARKDAKERKATESEVTSQTTIASMLASMEALTVALSAERNKSTTAEERTVTFGEVNEELGLFGGMGEESSSYFATEAVSSDEEIQSGRDILRQELLRLRESLNTQEMAVKELRRDREKRRREQTSLESQHKELSGSVGTDRDTPERSRQRAKAMRQNWSRVQLESLIYELEERIDRLEEQERLGTSIQEMNERLANHKATKNEGQPLPERKASTGTGAGGPPPEPGSNAQTGQESGMEAYFGNPSYTSEATYAEDMIQAEIELLQHISETKLFEEQPQYSTDEEDAYEDAYENYTTHASPWNPCLDPDDEGKGEPGSPKDDSVSSSTAATNTESTEESDLKPLQDDVVHERTEGMKNPSVREAVAHRNGHHGTPRK
jgi:hypothetical protein